METLLHKISDADKLRADICDLGFDNKALPFDALSGKRIADSYALLGRVENFIRNSTFDNGYRTSLRSYFESLPRRSPYEIKTSEDVKHEVKLLGFFSDLYAIVKASEEGRSRNPSANEIEQLYSVCNSTIVPLEHPDASSVLARGYLEQSAKRHLEMFEWFDIHVSNVFEVQHTDQNNSITPLTNKQLLWYGTRITNWFPILMNGLQTPPKESPHDEYSFGRGLYFANVAANAAQYCPPSEPCGVLALVEVALGEPLELYAPDFEAFKNLGRRHSVHGRGRIIPNPKQNVVIDDGVMVPCGQLIDAPENVAQRTELTYDEFVVFHPKQTRLRYLVDVKFTRRNKD